MGLELSYLSEIWEALQQKYRKVPVKFNIDITISTLNLAAFRFQEIWW